MHYNNNNRIDLNTHALQTNITFNSTVTVGRYHRHNHPTNTPIPYRIRPMDFRNCPINLTKALFQYTPWHIQPKKIKRITMTTTNQYETLEDDDLDEYGDYINPWKLDCAATHNFVEKKLGY